MILMAESEKSLRDKIGLEAKGLKRTLRIGTSQFDDQKE